MSVIVIGLVVATVFLAALTRSTLGFGEAVVAMPILVLLPIGFRTAVSLMGLVGLGVALIATAGGGWRHADRRALVALVPAALVGIPVGLVVVRWVPGALVTAGLGVVLVAYGAASVFGGLDPDRRARAVDPRWAVVFGLVSGMLGSAYNINGVPVAVLGALRRWPPDRFRGTLQAHFLITGVFIVAAQGLGGLWSKNLPALFVLSLPAVGLATALGTRLRRHIPVHAFERYVFVFLAALGLSLLLRSA